MDKEIKLSVEELETLCYLYIDCKLSVLEETELYYVLLKTDKDSSLIKETKAIMGIERKTASRPVMYPKFVFYRAIAVFALMALLSVFLVLKNPIENNITGNTASVDIECVVYSHGERILGEEAMNIAQANISRVEEFEKFMQDNIEKGNQKLEKFITVLKCTQ